MYLADYHLHSRVSPDAGDSMTALAEAAEAAGLDELCFTDHVEPIVWGGTDLRGPYDWSVLTKEFEAAQAAMGDRIKLRLGIELGDACWNFAGEAAGGRAAPGLHHRLRPYALKAL